MEGLMDERGKVGVPSWILTLTKIFPFCHIINFIIITHYFHLQWSYFLSDIIFIESH